MKKLLVVILATLVPGLVLAQGYDRDRGRRTARYSDDAVRLQLKQAALGFGSFFDQEGVTFSSAALFGAAQLHGVGLPFVAAGTSSGIAIEGHPGVLFSKDFSLGRVQSLSTVDYRIWSVNRVPMSAVPLGLFQSGTMSRAFSGVDVLLYEQGSWSSGHDTRFVVGGDLGVLGPGNLVAEIYMFQQDVPIAFALFWGL